MAKPASATAPTDVGRAVAAIRAELAHIRTSFAHIEQELLDLEATNPQPASRRERPERYLRVLVEVYEYGGQHGVDADGFARIGARHGYDRRGLGGFFTGARAPLSRHNDRIRLTASGDELMDSYLAQTSSS